MLEGKSRIVERRARTEKEGLKEELISETEEERKIRNQWKARNRRKGDNNKKKSKKQKRG